jgi:uncharacterized membrane protein YidH (DUF202 family)
MIDTADALPPRDPGLQPERTVLAWRRTLLALVVADFFIWRAWVTRMHLSLDHAPMAALGLGVAAVAAAAATGMVAGCMLRRAHSLRTTNSAPSSLLLLTATGALVVLAACVIVSIFLST